MKPIAEEIVESSQSETVATELHESKSQATGKFKSKTESRYAEQLEADRLSGLIASWDYEPVRLKIAENAYYRPDFLVRFASGRPELREIKGSWKSKNARESRVRLKVAASKYPEFKFVAVTPERGGWRREEI